MDPILGTGNSAARAIEVSGSMCCSVAPVDRWGWSQPIYHHKLHEAGCAVLLFT